jgi:hypothetical protein
MDSPYLLKVNLQMINTPDADSYARTFFLYDNRDSAETSLTESMELDISFGRGSENTQYTSSDAKSNIGQDIIFFDETKDGYDKRSVRVAQYPLISNITDNTFMAKVKSPSTAPFENRPYEVTLEGTNKIYSVEDVDATEVDFVSMTDSGTYGYVSNPSYINNVHIIFNENYDEPYSYNFARGFFIIPISYFNFSTLETGGNGIDIEKLSVLLKNYVSLKVFAMPKQLDIPTQKPNDICFVDDDDITVERVLKYTE